MRRDREENNIVLRQRFSRASVGAGIAVGLLGGAHLVAWLSGAMGGLGNVVVTMKTNMALSLFLTGSALVILASRLRQNRLWMGAARWAAILALVIGGLTLLEHIFGWNFGIDQLLASEAIGAVGADSPNRMGPPGALCLMFAGMALLLFADTRERWAGVAQGLASAVITVSMLGVIGYCYEVRGLYAAGKITSIALPTALALLLLGTGMLFARPERGIASLISANDPGGVISRRLICPTILLLVLMGWLRLLGERNGLYETSLGTAILVLVFSLVFSGLVLSTSHKLSKLAEAESAMQGALQRQAMLIDLSPVATIVREVNGTITFWSEGARRLYGWSAQEALGQRTHDLFQTQFSEPLERIIEQIRTEGQWSGDLKHHTKDGRVLVVQSWWGAQFRPDGEVLELLESNLDVTDRRQAEEAQQRSRMLLAEGEKLSHTGAWEWELEIDRWTFSDEWLRVHGCTNAQLSPEELLAIAHPEDRGLVADALERVRKGISGYELEHRIVRLSDGVERVVRARGQFVRDPAGKVVRVYGFAQDITEQKAAEEELRALKDELEDQVARRTAELSEANKELEAFGYSVSHDLRAPLRHIDSYIRLLERKAGKGLDEQSRRYIRTITEAAGRMGNLIDDLLVLSRLGRATMQEEAVKLGPLLEQVEAELAPVIAGRNIEWQVGALPQVRGDSNLLRSALTNLLSNAIKFTRGKDPARIEIGSQWGDSELVIFVRDNGAGFDMQFADKLFGVFQRLHLQDQFEGTGVGLASVRRVIQRHGGRTWAEGEIGSGATFYFSLPQSRIILEQGEYEHAETHSVGRG